jgi:hypothetical protein
MQLQDDRSCHHHEGERIAVFDNNCRNAFLPLSGTFNGSRCIHNSSHIDTRVKRWNSNSVLIFKRM